MCVYMYLLNNRYFNGLMVTDTRTHTLRAAVTLPAQPSVVQARAPSDRLKAEVPCQAGRATAWSLSLLLHGCSATASNIPAPDLHRRGGAGRPSARLPSRAAGGTFTAPGAAVGTHGQGCPFPLLDPCPAWAQLRMPSRMAHFIFQLHEGPLQKRVKKRERAREKKKGTKAI